MIFGVSKWGRISLLNTFITYYDLTIITDRCREALSKCQSSQFIVQVVVLSNISDICCVKVRKNITLLNTFITYYDFTIITESCREALSKCQSSQFIVQVVLLSNISDICCVKVRQNITFKHIHHLLWSHNYHRKL